MTIDRSEFGRMRDGRSVELYTLALPGGLRARITNLGGTVVALEAPDRDGRLDDVTLGLDGLGGYLDNRSFQGALIGRYGNRIAGSRVEVDGVSYQLTANEGPHQLHGGAGFHTRLWTAAPADGPDGPALALEYTSPDGEDGFPGRVVAKVTYRLTGEGALRVEYSAATDRPTVVNLTQHSYWNLAGHAAGSIEDHVLQLRASRFLPVDRACIPTGELRAVAGTPFDFLAPMPIGARITAADAQLEIGKGYDHCFVVDGWDRTLRAVADVVEPRSGRRMTVRTTEPGLQLYSGNHLAGIPSKHGKPYGARGGFCLEAQHFPDSPHHPEFPSTVLRPGETYSQTTEYVFGLASSAG